MDREARTMLEPYVNKLSAFESADGIAEFLANEGIKGLVRNPTHCAIGRYVNGETGLQALVCNTGIFANWNDWEDHTKYNTPGIPMTAAMVEFVRRFDCGYYPMLVAK